MKSTCNPAEFFLSGNMFSFLAGSLVNRDLEFPLVFLQAPGGAAETNGRPRGEQLRADRRTQRSGENHGELPVRKMDVMRPEISGGPSQTPVCVLQLLKCVLRELSKETEVQRNLLQVHLNGDQPAVQNSVSL